MTGAASWGWTAGRSWTRVRAGCRCPACRTRWRSRWSRRGTRHAAPRAPPLGVGGGACRGCGPSRERVGGPVPRPFDSWYLAEDGGTPVLSMRACEWLPPRAYLPVALALAGTPTASFQTRAVAWLSAGGRCAERRIAEVDASERWCEQPTTDRPVWTVWTVPAATRLAGRPAGGAHFLTPHGDEPLLDELYRWHPDVAVSRRSRPAGRRRPGPQPAAPRGRR